MATHSTEPTADLAGAEAIQSHAHREAHPAEYPDALPASEVTYYAAHAGGVPDGDQEVGGSPTDLPDKKHTHDGVDIADLGMDEDDDEVDDRPETVQEKRRRKRATMSWPRRCMETIIPPGGMVASAFTLGSATLGAGILGLPAAFNSMGLALALIILMAMVVLTLFSLWLMARTAQITGLRTYADISRAILGFWPSVLISFFLVLFCLGTDVSYIISIGNLLSPILEHESVPTYWRSKSANRLLTSLIWLICILPMCLLKSIDSMRHVSTVAVGCVLFFVLCVIVNFGEYVSENGWRDDVRFFNHGNDAIVGLGVIAFSCLVQMNAYEIYYQSNRPSPLRFVRDGALAMGVCGMLYVCAGVFGYGRFGPAVIDSILLEYQPREDPEFWVAYVGMLLKLCVGFALHQIPIRDVFYTYMGWDSHTMSWLKNAFWSAISATIVLIAGLFIPSINIVLGLVGALCGGFVGMLYPPIMYMYCGNWSLKKVGWFQYIATYTLILAGVVSVVFGTAASIYGIL